MGLDVARHAPLHCELQWDGTYYRSRQYNTKAKMKIDVTFNVYADARGGDPDRTSPTLRSYHQALWSKPLPSGDDFRLDQKRGAYLYHSSALGTFYLGSDAITHSYKHQVRKQWLTKQIPNEVNALFEIGSTMGAFTLFPNKRIDKQPTINQARGTHRWIDDRFDLTLACIQRFYSGQQSPLSDVLLRYKGFFDLFQDFKGYTDFFLLQDLIDKNGNIRFYLPFDDFKAPPTFARVDDYLVYQEGAMNFVRARNQRICDYVAGVGR
jgi:hypothetical protein